MPRPTQGYLDTTGRPDRLAGGVRMIPVSTPSGEFKVGTRAWFAGPPGFLRDLDAG